MNIAHFGTFDIESYGDLLFPLILERRLASLGAKVTHFSPLGGPPVWQDCVSSLPVGEIFEKGKNFDAVIVGGGDIIQSVMASTKVYGKKNLRTIFGYPSLWVAAAHASMERGIPLCWNAPGVPSSMLPEHQRMLRWATGSVDYLSVRNRESRFRLLEAGVMNHIELVPDTALEVSNLWTQAELDEAHASVWQRMGRNIPDRTVIVHLNPLNVREGEQEIVRCIEAIGRRWEATPVLVPLCRWSGDMALQQNIAASRSIEPIVATEPRSLREIAALFAHAKGYFGSSLHGMITASAFGKKGLFVAQKQAKLEGFLEWFGLKRWRVSEWRVAAKVAEDLLSMPLDPWTSVRSSSARYLDEHWERVIEVIHSGGGGKRALLQQFPSSDCGVEASAYLPLVPEVLCREDYLSGNLKESPWVQVFANKGSNYYESDSMLQQIDRDKLCTFRFAHIERLYSTGSLPLRIDPVNMPAILQIFNICIVRDSDHVVLYSAKTEEDFGKFNFSAGLLSRIYKQTLFLISSDHDPQIYLPMFGDLGEEKCTLEITLQVFSTDLGMISFCQQLIDLRRDLGVSLESTRRLVPSETAGEIQNKRALDKQSLDEISPDEIAACCREYASKWRVSPAIHPQDFIFRFLLTRHDFAGLEDAVRRYFDNARRSAELLKSILENDLAVDVGARKSMLEFASGYGAVTRHLRQVFPKFEITSSDIHPEANSFITEKLYAKAFQSSFIPERFAAGGEFDLVFALSFFSHMPATTWSRWLSVLFKTVRVGGSLIFTTHGRKSLRTMSMDASLVEEGFYFRPESEQGDLDKELYGTTFTSSRFVVGQIEALDDSQLRLVRAGFWWGHQDLYVVSKIASPLNCPVVDANIYQGDSKVEGYVDAISVDERKGIGEIHRTMHINGWVAPDIKGDKPADSIILLFQAEGGFQFSYDPIREDRNDVASVFKNSALVRTGFRAAVNISALKGNLTLLLAVRCGTKRKLCHNVAVPLKTS